MHTIHALKLPWLLVATPQLVDPNFRKKIVLVVEHGSHGSMGFVINQPIRTPLADLMLESNITIPRHIPAWYGGPVQCEQGLILHEGIAHDTVVGPEPDPQSCDAQYLLSSSDIALTNLVFQLDAKQHEGEARGFLHSGLARLYPYRFLVGYAGWRGGQLESEIRQGAWLAMPASPQLIFDTPWPEMWQTTMSVMGIDPRTIAPLPQHLAH
jgi:putative transcriptional regulator